MPAVLWARLVRNLERLVEELVYHRVLTGRVAVWAGYRDGHAGEGRATLEAPSDRFDVLLDTYRPCLRRAWLPRVPASRMHLFGSSGDTIPISRPSLSDELEIRRAPGIHPGARANEKPAESRDNSTLLQLYVQT